MHILFIGDIVGKPGRRILARHLKSLLTIEEIDFCIANGENAAGGSGLTPALAEELYTYGVQCITNGDHTWRKKELLQTIDKDKRLLRPANYPEQCPGRGLGIYETEKGSVAVINVLGRVFMDPMDCPFNTVDKLLTSIADEVNTICIDLHAEATSEKIAMSWHVNGKVSALIGTHTHVPTADARILDGGTAYITDVGMTGPYDSVIGRDKNNVLQAMRSRMPIPFPVASSDVRLCAVKITTDDLSGRAIDIKRIELTENSTI